MDKVKISQDQIKFSPNFNLTTKDIYFGIGFTDYNFNQVNISNLSFLLIDLKIWDVDNITNKYIVKTVELGPCNIDRFINYTDFYLLTPLKQELFKNKISLLICPLYDFKAGFTVPNFALNQQFIQFTVRFSNTSILDEAKQLLLENHYRLNFIYSNLEVNSGEKDYPYVRYIDSYNIHIDFELNKRKEFKITPFGMKDDNNLLGGGTFTWLNTSLSIQPNFTVFKIEKGSDSLSIISNRTYPIKDNNNRPELNLCSIRLILNPSMTIKRRSYQKFNEILAAVSSMISTGLLFLSIIMNHYNTAQGKNKMIKSLYRNEGIQNIKSFSIDLNETINNALINKFVIFLCKFRTTKSQLISIMIK